jgi:hypothetical protein
MSTAEQELARALNDDVRASGGLGSKYLDTCRII